jgi:hypothetical protein
VRSGTLLNSVLRYGAVAVLLGVLLGGTAAHADDRDVPPLPPPRVIGAEAPAPIAATNPAVHRNEEPATAEGAARSPVDLMFDGDPLPGQPGGPPDVGPTEPGLAQPPQPMTTEEILRSLETGGPSGAGAFSPADLAAPRTPVVRRRKLIDGYFRFRYRGRIDDDDESDHDLYQYLSLDIGDDTRPGWSGAFNGRLVQDVDGRDDGGQFYVWDSIQDTYDSAVTGHIYHAYVNYRPNSCFLEQVRVGRQWLELGEVFLMDGVTADFHPIPQKQDFTISVTGGVPANLFESSPRGDWYAGGTIEGRPWRGGDLRFDYVHIEDKTGYYGYRKNDLYTISLWQRVSQNVTARASYQHLNDDPRYFTVAFDGFIPRWDALVRGSYRALLETQFAQTLQLDPYFVTELQLEPYWDLDLSAAKNFGNCFALEGGLTIRQLFDEADAGRYNHSFERYFATASTFDWPARNVSLVLTGEWWNSADDTQAIAFDIEWEPSRCWRFLLGTDYALWRYDLYTDSERQDSRSVYLRARWTPNDRWGFDTRIRYEDDDFGEYLILNVGFQYNF